MSEYFGAYLQNYSRAVVLGLAPSVTAYKPDNSLKIGVNDIEKYHHVDHLIIMDRPNVFTKERLSIIKKSTPDLLLSFSDEWRFMKMFHKIELAKNRSCLDQIESKNIYPYSIMSPYVGIVHAYKLGIKEIIIYGVDLQNHKTLSTDIKQERILNDISRLAVYFSYRKVNLMVYNKSSLLSKVLKYLSNE